ncbi:MAG: hypothetical protein IKT87_06610 [Bacteroidaceae bacterium]|nr:hypothetical protein [Bacteroidaceae bacterium]
MGMFKTREPRKFRRVSIYTDERREKLDKLVNDYKREINELPPTEEDYTQNRFKGKFSQFTPRTQRFSEGGRGMIKWPIALVVIILLIWFMRWLLIGEIPF